MIKGNVLIVDDSPILRRSIRRALLQAGVDDAQIREAGHGKEALERLGEEPAALVLLDLNMPVMDGETFLKTLREAGGLGDPAVIVVTTEGNVGRLYRLGQLGVSGYLHKPFEPEELRSIVGDVLGKAS